MFDHFSGKIYQVLEALDYGDAVSNQVLRLDLLLKSLGITCEIYSKYSHPKVSKHTKGLEDLLVDAKDIIFYHFSGYAEFSAETVMRKNCTKIILYHNITPAEYFPLGSPQYEFCYEGRKQIKEILALFHFAIGDSQYNVDELIQMGINKGNTSVLPIIVSNPLNSVDRAKTEKLTWLFLGRIAPNKRQDVLIKQFANYLREYDSNSQLFLVGAYDMRDEYYKKIIRLIRKLGLKKSVHLTGKVSDYELISYFQKADVYVSLSEHEGFGVPLVESTHFDLPVIALKSSAVGETLLNSPGLITKSAQLPGTVHRLFSDKPFYDTLIAHQQLVRDKYLPSTIRFCLEQILERLIPSPYQFKTVSIVVCTYNRADFLDRCLDYLQYQNNSSFEVIVVNGPSEDNTSQVLENYRGKIKIAENATKNLSTSRNLGIEQASGDIVAFIDDDALPYDDWVENLLKAYNSVPYFIAGVGGPTFYAGTLEYQDQDLQFNTTAEVRQNVTKTETSLGGWHRYLIGTNASFRRDVLFDTQGFDEQYDYFLDETDLCYRLTVEQNLLLHYDPHVFVRHEFAQSDNRQGKYKYNWFTICRNTAYFILKANPHLPTNDGIALINAHMQRNRSQNFQNAFERGEISIYERDNFISEVWRGVKQGIEDAKHHRKTRPLTDKSETFLPYKLNRFYPVKGNGIGQLHIVILSREFTPFTKSGGIGTLYYNLASELLQMGHYVTVVTQGDHKEEYVRGRFVIVTIPNSYTIEDQWQTAVFVNNINWAISAKEKIVQLHVRRKIDIIDTALWDFEAFALLQDKCHQIPVCVRLVTPLKVALEINQWRLSKRERNLMAMAEKEVIEKADIVIPISKSIEKTITQNYNVEADGRWHRSYIGIAYWPFFDVNLGYNDLGSLSGQLTLIPSGTYKILFFGRLEKRKGIDIFFDAIKRVDRNDIQAQFIVAGEDLEDWQGKAGFDEGLKDQIIFLGRVEDAKKDILLHFADVVVFPSKYESFGLVPLEAFVHGTPVIAANTGAIPEVVIDNDCGLLFEPENPSDLANCIKKLAQDRDLQTRLSIGAKKRVRMLSSRIMAAETMEIYSSVLI